MATRFCFWPVFPDDVVPSRGPELSDSLICSSPFSQAQNFNLISISQNSRLLARVYSPQAPLLLNLLTTLVCFQLVPASIHPPPAQPCLLHPTLPSPLSFPSPSPPPWISLLVSSAIHKKYVVIID